MATMTVTRHPPIRDQIASILRAAIINLDFQPGQLLVERELCELTGASRPSVREALRQLEAEGLVESRNGRGTIVRVLSVDEVRHLYEVRAELEGLASRLFSVRAQPADRRALEAAMSDLRTATTDGGSARILAAQGAFYSALFSGAGNPVLDHVVQGLQVRVAQFRALTLTVPGRAEESLREFESIVAAIASGDGEAAHRSASAHVRAAGDVMASVAAARDAR